MHTKAGPILSIHSEDIEWKRNSDLLIKGHNSKFYHLVLTILVETSNYINTERQGESSIAPLFQSPAVKIIIMTRFTVVVLCKSFISQETYKHSYSPSRANGQFFFYFM